MKTWIGASEISIWLAECSQCSCGSNIKNNSNHLLVLPATQVNQLYVARLVIKCVAVIEKVNDLKNCCVILLMYIYPVDTVETLDSTLLLSRQLFFQLISVFFHVPASYASKHHLNFMLVPELRNCLSNCMKQFFFFGISVFIHYRNAPIDYWRSWKMT